MQIFGLNVIYFTVFDIDIELSRVRRKFEQTESHENIVVEIAPKWRQYVEICVFSV